jgi:hypothetical protein
MSQHYHALVWIDHHEAKVFQFDATDVEHTTVRSSNPHQHLHHKANSGDSGHAPLDKEFLKHVAASVAQACAILITGPASTKTELATYMGRHHRSWRRGSQASNPWIIRLTASSWHSDDRSSKRTIGCIPSRIADADERCVVRA